MGLGVGLCVGQEAGQGVGYGAVLCVELGVLWRVRGS